MPAAAAAMEMWTPPRAVPGSSLDRLSHDDVLRIFSILDSALRIERHADLLQWLHGGIQAFLPHQILIAAWGDFACGMIHFDAISPLPYARTAHLDGERTRLWLRQLFDRWLVGLRMPFNTSAASDLLGLQQHSAYPGSWGVPETNTLLVHGIKDQRGRYYCLYVLFGSDELAADPAVDIFCLLLPYIDAAQRQVMPLPQQYRAAGPMASGDRGLSQREIEIMDWVGRGKTNLEIGMILNISAFTVKNHLRRIFRKLDVINRAQAVARVKPLDDTESLR